MATVKVTLPPTFEPNTPKKGAFSFLSWKAHRVHSGETNSFAFEDARGKLLEFKLLFNVLSSNYFDKTKILFSIEILRLVGL